jgi:hypothetical protein
MDAWQFSLFFVALVVGYVLVHLRLVRFEEHLQKLGGIRGLDDRLRALDDRLGKLGETFDRIRVDRVEDGLDRLHEDLQDLRETTASVQHAVVQIPAPQAPAPAPAPTVVVTNEPTPEPQPNRILALVESRLLQLGYHDIDVLTNLEQADVSREVEVLVECWRGGMPVKGRVLVKNGSVRDVAIQTVATMFP